MPSRTKSIKGSRLSVVRDMKPTLSHEWLRAPGVCALCIAHVSPRPFGILLHSSPYSFDWQLLNTSA